MRVSSGLLDQLNGECPYKVLGVPTDAAEADIKKAYRKLALKHHPDRNEGSNEEFSKIHNAYQFLSDADEKKCYDYKLRKRNEDVADPNFSVFDADMNRELGSPSKGRSKTSKSEKTASPKTKPGERRQVSLKTATKVRNGQRVTVTERVWELPDGTLQTETETKSERGSSTKLPKKSKSKSKKEPTTSTRLIEEGTKMEITTIYPNGREEVRIEPIENTKSPRKSKSKKPPVFSPKSVMSPGFASRPIMKSPVPKGPSRNASPVVKVHSRVVVGRKITEKHYADGSVEFYDEPVGGSASNKLPMVPMHYSL